jgi:hypothetical protein
MSPQEELFSAIIEEDCVRAGAVLASHHELVVRPKDGCQPLNYAAKINSKAWRTLRIYGAYMTSVDKDGKTPGHYFGANGNEEGVREYVAAGGDLSIPDAEGKTPIGNLTARDAEAANRIREYAEKREGKITKGKIV